MVFTGPRLKGGIYEDGRKGLRTYLPCIPGKEGCIGTWREDQLQMSSERWFN
jgi:hypothetical protein